MKVNLRFLKCERGAGAYISTVMFLIISLLFVGGTFLWQVKSQTQVNALDSSRMEERYSVEPLFSYSLELESYSADINVKNTGSIEINLVQAWIIDVDHNDHKQIDISYNLPVGEYISIDDEIDELISSLSHPFDLVTTEYFFKVVSERGNIASSKLMPQAAFQSHWPAVIIPDASYVVKHGANVYIHLEVWNRLDEEIHLTLIVASRMDQGAEHSELVYIDWILPPRVISIGHFRAESKRLFQTGNRLFIELADSDGMIISSYYFTVQ